MKPKVTVTSILNYLYPYEEKEVSPILKMHGELSHEEICKHYPSNDYDCEVKLELDRGFYVLIGKADIVDHERKLILEVKPRSTLRNMIKSKRARLQLSAYVAMWRKLVYGTVENGYYGAWLVYEWRNPRKFSIVKPFYLDMTVLQLFDSVAKEILRRRKKDGNRPSENSELHIRGAKEGSTVSGLRSIEQ